MTLRFVEIATHRCEIMRDSSVQCEFAQLSVRGFQRTVCSSGERDGDGVQRRLGGGSVTSGMGRAKNESCEQQTSLGRHEILLTMP
jgi:hypothetical protein